MKVETQVAIILDLNKCTGYHTRSVTYKDTRTDRSGAEYMWFNNMETKPGIRYPKHQEDQERYKGGQVLNRKRKLELKSGSKISKIALGKIFYNPGMPLIKDYYGPWSYNYERLTAAKSGKHSPVARTYSEVTGDNTETE